MADLTAALGGPFVATDVSDSLEAQLADAMLAAGLVPPAVLRFDGRLHRFASDGKKKNGDKPGWYVAFGDGVPAARFGCWRSGVNERWRARGGAPLTAAEELELERAMAAAQAQRDEEQARRHEVASDVVEEIWASLPEATGEHPYLKRKGVQPHGLRVTGDGRLVAPLFTPGWDLASLQYIDSEGGKLYHPGGQTQGKFWMLGEVTPEGGTLYVVEGFATGATVHEVTGAVVVVAYSASNLVPVVGMLRELYGAGADVVVVADNDKSGLGQRYAEQAAAKHGARVVVPPILGDANDYVQAGKNLLELLDPKITSPSKAWLVKWSDFIFQPAPLAWLIRGWVQANALMMVHGPSGHGKTFTVLDWCCHMASGLTDWRGAKVRSGDVVYLAGEGHHGLRARGAAWAHRHGVTPDRMYVSSSGCDLDKPEGLRKTIDSISAWRARPALIVVDTLHRFLAGDENSATDTKAMLDSCAALMSTFGCSVLLVHHTGNSEEAQKRARGSSAWRGALDIEVSITRASGDEDTIEITQRKSKDAELAAPVHACLEKVTIPGWIDEDGNPVTSAVLVSSEAPPERVKPTKESKKLAEHAKLFERAWWHTGAEVQDGRPYVSRSGMLSYLMDVEGLSERVATQRVKPADDPGRPIRNLVDNRIIEPRHHGWCVIDDVLSSSWLLSRVER